MTQDANPKRITLAGGCFWGVDAYFARLYGVLSTTSGYANSQVTSPSYEQVCTGTTDAAEAVQIEYAPTQIGLGALLDQYFSIIDPTTLNRQGNDVGTQYRTGIYYEDPEDLPLIERVIADQKAQLEQPLAVEVMPLENFYPAEEHHQDYLIKHPLGYCHVNLRQAPKGPLHSRYDEPRGFDPETWTRPELDQLQAQLDPLAFHVTQEQGTEHPFTGAYDASFEPGLYVDIVSGEPLFTSDSKYDAGCGWPSFTRPAEGVQLQERADHSHGMVRTEVRSPYADSHLGHVFTDGPAEEGGLRYCMNSNALRFIPYEDLEREGYGEWKDRIKK